MRRLRIGTRRSKLAVAQSQLVAEAIRAHHRGARAELVEIVTAGDRAEGRLAAVGGKGLFTAQLESALRDGSIDLAVHSAKDVPKDLEAHFSIVAVPVRADPRDALITPNGSDVGGLPPGARVGTASVRRAAQLRHLRSDLEVVPVRGNIDTRLRKVLEDTAEHLDAVVLAMAGLIRTGLAEAWAGCICPLEAFIPAAGQGALVVEALAGNDEVAQLVEPLDHRPTHEALLAERAVLADLGADCHSCVAVHVVQTGGAWCGFGMAAREDGSDLRRSKATGKTAAAAGRDLSAAMRDGGAMELLHDIGSA